MYSLVFGYCFKDLNAGLAGSLSWYLRLAPARVWFVQMVAYMDSSTHSLIYNMDLYMDSSTHSLI